MAEETEKEHGLPYASLSRLFSEMTPTTSTHFIYQHKLHEWQWGKEGNAFPGKAANVVKNSTVYYHPTSVTNPLSPHSEHILLFLLPSSHQS